MPNIFKIECLKSKSTEERVYNYPDVLKKLTYSKCWGNLVDKEIKKQLEVYSGSQLTFSSRGTHVRLKVINDSPYKPSLTGSKKS